MLFILILRFLPILVPLIAIGFWVNVVYVFFFKSVPAYINDGILQIMGMDFFLLLNFYQYVAVFMTFFVLYLTIQNKKVKDWFGLFKLFINLLFCIQLGAFMLFISLLILSLWADNASVLSSEFLDSNSWLEVAWLSCKSFGLFVLHYLSFSLFMLTFGYCLEELKHRAPRHLSKVNIVFCFLFTFLFGWIINQKIGFYSKELIDIPAYRLFTIVLLVAPVICFVIAVIVNHVKGTVAVWYNRLSVYPLISIYIVTSIAFSMMILILFYPVFKDLYQIVLAFVSGHFLGASVAIIFFYSLYLVVLMGIIKLTLLDFINDIIKRRHYLP